MTENKQPVVFALAGKRDGEIVSSETDFAGSDENLWVAVEKELRGQLNEQGGKDKANVHLALEDGGDLKLATARDFSKAYSEVHVHDTVRVRIKAEESLQTGAMRNAALLGIRPGNPVFDEEAFRKAVELASRAWADVPDIGAWVAEQRGSSAFSRRTRNVSCGQC
ncbi:MAG: hypothetical protein JJU29_22715 [Verrucomicrobia bacterium]|nr:hypothetical protein [Verrucomicrobiota bacterium]MCH8514589.1 hypothetical protein [Kiritimatiellia bacterium]